MSGDDDTVFSKIFDRIKRSVGNAFRPWRRDWSCLLGGVVISYEPNLSGLMDREELVSACNLSDHLICWCPNQQTPARVLPQDAVLVVEQRVLFLHSQCRQ